MPVCAGVPPRVFALPFVCCCLFVCFCLLFCFCFCNRLLRVVVFCCCFHCLLCVWVLLLLLLFLGGRGRGVQVAFLCLMICNGSLPPGCPNSVWRVPASQSGEWVLGLNSSRTGRQHQSQPVYDGDGDGAGNRRWVGGNRRWVGGGPWVGAREGRAGGGGREPGLCHSNCTSQARLRPAWKASRKTATTTTWLRYYTRYWIHSGHWWSHSFLQLCYSSGYSCGEQSHCQWQRHCTVHTESSGAAVSSARKVEVDVHGGSHPYGFCGRKANEFHERVKARPRIPPEKDRRDPWIAVTMKVLRRCPLAIAQRLVHYGITAVSTAVLGRVTRTVSVALLLKNNPKRKKSNFRSPAPPPCSWSLLG